MLQGARFTGSSIDLGFFGGAKTSDISLSNAFVKSMSTSASFLFLGFLVVNGDPFSVGGSSEPTKQNIYFKTEDSERST